MVLKAQKKVHLYDYNLQWKLQWKMIISITYAGFILHTIFSNVFDFSWLYTKLYTYNSVLHLTLLTMYCIIYFTVLYYI